MTGPERETVQTRRQVLAATGVGVASLAGLAGTGTARAAPGDQNWVFRTDGSFSSAPTVVGGTVYVGPGHTLYALDAETGDVEWTFETETEIRRAPTVVDGTVYVSSNVVHALDAETGSQRWQFSVPEDEDEVTGPPTVVDGTVYVGSHFALHALDGGTGTREWTNTDGGYYRTTVTVVGDTAYLYVSPQGFDRVIAVDTTTGETRWWFEPRGGEGQLTVADGLVYVNTEDAMAALNATTGDPLWELSGWHPHSPPAPTVTNGYVYDVNRSAGVSAIETATGDVAWTATGEFINAARPPTVAGDTVYAGYDGLRDGQVETGLYAADATDGTVRWSVALSATLRRPLVVDGTVYVGTEGGAVHAIETEGTTSSEDSLAMLGTLGHHGGWRYADQRIETEPNSTALGPGFGIGTTLAALGGAGYLCRRRLAGETSGTGDE